MTALVDLLLNDMSILIAVVYFLLQPFIGNTTIGRTILASRDLNFDAYFYWISVGALLAIYLICDLGFILALTYLKRKLHQNVPPFKLGINFMSIKIKSLVYLQLRRCHALLYQRRSFLKSKEERVVAVRQNWKTRQLLLLLEVKWK